MSPTRLMRCVGWAWLVSMAGVTTATAQEVDQGVGAVLRGLDKVDAQVQDIEISIGQVVEFGRLQIRLQECRYPADDAVADAFAFLEIRDVPRDEQVFSGWMLASSPALNALEHARYDVWVLRCQTE